MDLGVSMIHEGTKRCGLKGSGLDELFYGIVKVLTPTNAFRFNLKRTKELGLPDSYNDSRHFALIFPQVSHGTAGYGTT